MQKGIFIEGTSSCVFIEANLSNNCNQKELKKITEFVKKSCSENVHVVISFGKKAWQLMQPNWTPPLLQDFTALKGKKGYRMPSTQADILIWAHSSSKSHIYDFTETAKEVTTGILDLAIVQEGFEYHDSRDLIGFVDGIGNPKDEKKIAAAIVPPGNIGNGGSYVFTQQWNHNLKSFLKNTIATQEKIIGRTKKDSVELEGDAMPKDSHISKTDLKVDGEGMKIYRRSFPFANKETKGLFFQTFTCDPRRVDIQ